MSLTGRKTGGMARDLPDEMPARWLEQIRVLVQDLIGRSAGETRRYFEETRRHFDVVGEGFRADVRAIAKGHRDSSSGSIVSSRKFGATSAEWSAASCGSKRVASLDALEAPRRYSGRASPSRRR